MNEEPKNKNVAFWEVVDKDTLCCNQTIYRAIEALIEQKYDYEQDPTKATIFPRHIEVIGYAKIKHPRAAKYDPWQCEDVEKIVVDLVDYFGMHPELVEGMVVKFEGV